MGDRSRTKAAVCTAIGGAAIRCRAAMVRSAVRRMDAQASQPLVSATQLKRLGCARGV